MPTAAIVKGLSIVLVIYLCALAGLYFLQRKILYHPVDFYTPLAETNADKTFREITTHTDDGLDLKAWYAPATFRPYTLVFFHGNGDSLRTVVNIGNPYVKAGYGFLAVEYRGYSGLPGNPTEEGIYQDARAAIKNLIASGIPAKNMILFGQSLGTGVAVQMATEFHVSGVMLLSPYLSIGKAAQARYPIFPADMLVKDRFDSFKKITEIRGPLLIVHGEKDSVIPYEQGQKLFELAIQPKTFHSFPLAGHNDIFNNGFETFSILWLSQLGWPQ